MEEDERLLPEDYEDCIPQFWHLGQHEHERPEARDAISFDEAGKEARKVRTRALLLPHLHHFSATHRLKASVNGRLEIPKLNTVASGYNYTSSSHNPVTLGPFRSFPGPNFFYA